VSQKTIESRLTRAHALLRRRLDRAWREQDGRARAFYLAMAPAGQGWTFLGGALMTKQSVLIVLGVAALVGWVVTWRVLEPTARERATPTAEVAPPAPSAVLPSVESTAGREELPAAAELATPAPGLTPVVSQEELELARALERLGPVLDRSLEGRMDPGTILDTALLVAAHEAGNPLAELDSFGRLLLPIEGLPAGVTAELCVSNPRNRRTTVLTLQIHLERAASRPLVFEDYERAGPSVQLMATTKDGELLDFSLLTDVQPGQRTAVVDPPRLTYGMNLYTPLASPFEWRLKASGLQEMEGALGPDGGRIYHSGSWEVPQVLEGVPWPRVEDIQRFSRRLLEMHAAAKDRTSR